MAAAGVRPCPTGGLTPAGALLSSASRKFTTAVLFVLYQGPV
jgi:hypothetical protein